MRQENLEILSRFEAVWQRIHSEQKGQTQAPNCELEALMDGLHYRWMGVQQLARCTCGQEKSRLLALSAQIKKQYQMLQLHYFLKEGDTYFASTQPNFASYTPYNLRKLWQSTVENAETLKKCNLKGEFVFVAELESMDDEFQLQKKELEALIRQLLQ